MACFHRGALDQYIKPTVEEQIEYKMNYVKGAYSLRS